MAGIYHPSRGGVRGGKDQFNWDDVKTDKDRENYLGHSLMVPVGKWQEGKDLMWYTRNKNDQEISEKEKQKKEELQAVKDLEKRAMEAALGKKSFSMGTTSLTAKELQEVLSRGKTEHNSDDRIHGVGHKTSSKSKTEKYGTSFEGFDGGTKNNRDDAEREREKKSKKKKKEKKKKKKKEQSNNDDDDDALRRKRRHSSDYDEETRRHAPHLSDKRKSSETTRHQSSRRNYEKVDTKNIDNRSRNDYKHEYSKDSKSDRRRSDDKNYDRRLERRDSYKERNKRSRYSDSEEDGRYKKRSDKRSEDRHHHTSSRRSRRHDIDSSD